MDKMSMDKIKEFWLKYEQKIVLTVAFCLVAVISFQFGMFQSQKSQQKPLIIEKQINAQQEGQSAPSAVSAPLGNTTATILPAKTAQAIPAGDCPYVGSKSSTKFYLATCSWAKSIKPENVVCFKNPEQATTQGRTESKCK